MSEPSTIPTSGSHPIPKRRGILQALGRGIIRLYALTILLVVVWTGYTAVAYLVRFVFTPSHVPAQFLDRGVSLDTDALRTGQLRAAAESIRAPVGHYHSIDRWFESDPLSGCATSGCHGPLPHMKRKEVRAFANLHATFMSCSMCHAAGAQPPVHAAWVRLGDGSMQEAPSLLRLIRLLETEASKLTADPPGVHPRIVELLSHAVGIAGDPLLNYLLMQIQTSEPGSPVWRTAVAQLAAELPNHARGEYGAKLAPAAEAARMKQEASTLRELAGRYLAVAEGSPERKQLHEKIHANVLAKPDACLSCHGGEPARLDFEALGYSPQRIATLRSTPIARMIQEMREGRPFHLPELLEGGHGR